MKKVIIFLLGAVAFGCSNEQANPSPSEIARQKLVGRTWAIYSVTVNGIDATSQFNDLSITFTEHGFSTENGSVLWPSTGTWEFIDEKASAFMRNDGVEVAISELNNSTLRLEVAWDRTTYGNGRIQSINGKHVFVFF